MVGVALLALTVVFSLACDQYDQKADDSYFKPHRVTHYSGGQKIGSGLPRQSPT